VSRWSWIALGAGAYLAFTLSAFPAATALAWFGPSQIAAVGVEGTIWSGRAASVSIDRLGITGLRWSLRPIALVFGQLGGHVEGQLRDGFVNADFAASRSRVELTNLRGGTAIGALVDVLPVRGVNGQLSANLSRLVLEDGWPSSAVGELRVAALEVTPLIPTPGVSVVGIGDYTITFAEAPPGELAARIVDSGGPLEVTGTVTLGAGRAYALDARIKPRPGAPEQLVEGLKIMTAEPDAEGRRRLMLTGSL
jgi:general secretion pathway protein N